MGWVLWMSQRVSDDVSAPDDVIPRSWLPDGDQRRAKPMSWTADSSSRALPALDQRLTKPIHSEESSRVATARISPLGLHAIEVTMEPCESSIRSMYDFRGLSFKAAVLEIYQRRHSASPPTARTEGSFGFHAVCSTCVESGTVSILV